MTFPHTLRYSFDIMYANLQEEEMLATHLLTERLNVGAAGAYARNLTGLELHAFSVEIGELNTVHVFGTGDLLSLAGRSDLEAQRASAARVFPLARRHGSIRRDPETKIYELREYRPRGEEAEAFVTRMLDAMAVRERYSQCSGIWTREQSGSMSVLHLWGYRDLAHRDAARAGVAQERAWSDYAAYALTVLEHMRSDLLLPITSL